MSRSLRAKRAGTTLFLSEALVVELLPDYFLWDLALSQRFGSTPNSPSRLRVREPSSILPLPSADSTLIVPTP